jgi:hypothetical protein
MFPPQRRPTIGEKYMMVKLWRTSFIGSGLLLMALTANAQVYQDDPYFRPDPGYRGSRDYRDYGGDRNYRAPAYSGAFPEIDQARTDLDRTMDMGYLSHGQRKTLMKARQDLDDLQYQWGRGHYSNHELDEAIGRIQSVANSGHLSYQARNMLQDDANRLRDLRARSYRR